MPQIIKEKFVVFITINGWGISLNTENNAIRKAEISGFKSLVFNYPATVISMPGLSDSENYRLLGLGHKTKSDDISSLSVSKIISQSNLSQLKISNSHDFPLLSVFFNNFSERLLGEDWRIVDNIKKRGIFSLTKQDLLVEKLIKNIKSRRYNFIFSSLSDIGFEVMKGDFLSIVSAVENVSSYLEKISQAVLSLDGVMVITSTYGGAEDVYNIGTGLPNKIKTNNPVPFLIIGNDFQGKTIGLEEAPNNDLSLLSPQGNYLDIAPTILKILDLNVPPEIEGESFV